MKVHIGKHTIDAEFTEHHTVLIEEAGLGETPRYSCEINGEVGWGDTRDSALMAALRVISFGLLGK